MDPKDFLVWLTSSAGASAVLSFLFERWAWFCAQPKARKPWLMYGSSVVLALSAYAIITFVPPAILDLLKPWFAIVAGLTVPFVASQIAHKADPAA